jgi:hypothetical protein
MGGCKDPGPGLCRRSTEQAHWCEWLGRRRLGWGFLVSHMHMHPPQSLNTKTGLLRNNGRRSRPRLRMKAVREDPLPHAPELSPLESLQGGVDELLRLLHVDPDSTQAGADAWRSVGCRQPASAGAPAAPQPRVARRAAAGTSRPFPAQEQARPPATEVAALT